MYLHFKLEIFHFNKFFIHVYVIVSRYTLGNHHIFVYFHFDEKYFPVELNHYVYLIWFRSPDPNSKIYRHFEQSYEKNVTATLPMKNPLVEMFM